jgi:hypothetical protein
MAAAAERILKVKSRDGKILEAPESVVKFSVTLKNLLDGEGLAARARRDRVLFFFLLLCETL